MRNYKTIDEWIASDTKTGIFQNYNLIRVVPKLFGQLTRITNFFSEEEVNDLIQRLPLHNKINGGFKYDGENQETIFNNQETYQQEFIDLFQSKFKIFFPNAKEFSMVWKVYKPTTNEEIILPLHIDDCDGVIIGYLKVPNNGGEIEFSLLNWKHKPIVGEALFFHPKDNNHIDHQVYGFSYGERMIFQIQVHNQFTTWSFFWFFPRVKYYLTSFSKIIFGILK